MFMSAIHCVKFMPLPCSVFWQGSAVLVCHLQQLFKRIAPCSSDSADALLASAIPPRLLHMLLLTADIAYVCQTAEGGGKASSTISHSARDLFWNDGLDPIRVLISRPKSVPASKPLGTFLQVQSLKDMAWYCHWKGLDDDEVWSGLPSIPVLALLPFLGIPDSLKEAFVGGLCQDDVPLLQEIAVGQFMENVVATMDLQLPDLGLLDLYKQGDLFAG